MNYIGIDIGGTWIKGTIAGDSFFNHFQGYHSTSLSVKKMKSPLHARVTIEEFVAALKEMISEFQQDPEEIEGIGISTPGIVNYQGDRIMRAASHLNVLKDGRWKAELEKHLKCSAVVINDADAASIGLAESGYLKGNRTIGVMPVGTGLGFAVWRNGRRWRPGKSLNLLGSIRTPEGYYDTLASASDLASMDEQKNLIHVLTDPSFKKIRASYLQKLAEIIETATILYNLDEVILCGGLADAACASNFSLERELNNRLKKPPLEREAPIKIIVAKEGNLLQLIGNLALAQGEAIAQKSRIIREYEALETEVPYQQDLQLQDLSAGEILYTLWKAEQQAGEGLKASLSIVAEVIEESVNRIKSGGRIIYVGAGTSGRIAAMDAVEIPCTYGFPEDRILALIAGGVADAAIEIESDFEEDASAMPEMLLLNIKPEDVVIGISASASAYYVQSALAFAKSRNALSLSIQTHKPKAAFSFCDYVIPLNSGNEVVAGSTRMKAGTATKKVLNFLSTSIMIGLGKVSGPYMVDVACINNKLVERARKILNVLFNLDDQEALKRLQAENMDLNQVIKNIQLNGKK